MGKLIRRIFYAQSTQMVAQQLLGKMFCIRVGSKKNQIQKFKIVETEAYLGTEDPACHSYKGKTKRNQSMFLEGGHSYVYFIYGMYFCFNVVTRLKEEPEAVLIRALEPLNQTSASCEFMKTNGPGKICKHLKIDRLDDGKKLYSREQRIWIEEPEKNEMRSIVVSKRIGISHPKAKQKQLRFYLKDCAYVSKIK